MVEVTWRIGLDDCMSYYWSRPSFTKAGFNKHELKRTVKDY